MLGTGGDGVVSGGSGGGAGGGQAAGGTTAMGGSGAGGSSSAAGGAAGAMAPATVCETPQPWALPTPAKVVGTGTSDSCTEDALRAAITSGGAITFACGAAPKTITVKQVLQVSKTTVIDGGGTITLDGGGTTRILSGSNLSVRNLRFIRAAAPASTDTKSMGGAIAGTSRSKVEVVGCTFESNVAGWGGGAIAVATGSTLTVSGSTFIGNKSWYGGAIYSLLSGLTVVNSVFLNNGTVTDGALGDGGAIGTDGASESPDDTVGGEVVICGTRIANSQAYGNGGAAYIWLYPPDRVTIDRTTVENNHVSANTRTNPGLGGAMRISNGEIIIKGSSFLSNISDSLGGALYLDCAPTCTILNTTFYANSAKGSGGAIFGGDKSQFNNVTFASNSAGSQGGALAGKNYVLNNTAFVDNKSAGQAMTCTSTGSGQHVLQWQSAKGNGGADACIAGVTAADPALGAPADNGGPTPTMLPSAQSAVRGAGAGCEATDQRGQPRPADACDLGAVEVP